MTDGQEVGQEGNKKRQESWLGRRSEQGVPANVKGWRFWLSHDHVRCPPLGLLLAVVKRSLMEEESVPGSFEDPASPRSIEEPASQPASSETGTNGGGT